MDEIRIWEPGEVEKVDLPEAVATGVVRVRQLSPALGASFVQLAHVEFDPGVRFRPHAHPSDQILFYLRGTGVVSVDGGPDQEVPEGGIVLLPKDRPHMHGCTDAGPAIHLSLIGDQATDFLEGGIPSWTRWMP